MVFKSAGCGVGFIWEDAIIKALSEFVERAAFQNSGAQNSTGFAAYPFIFRKERAKRKARALAYMEVVERYSWSQWLNRRQSAYKIKNTVSAKNKGFLQAIRRDFPSLLHVIIPKLSIRDIKLVILYAETENGLVCAAAARDTIVRAEQNALKELYIHACALYRMRHKRTIPQTPYEVKIDWISYQTQTFKKRLVFSGNESIHIPLTATFQDVKTEYEDTYVVQRCIIEGHDGGFLSADEIRI